jgi:cobalamin biosynthesis protein CobT
MGRRVLNRKEMRNDYDAAERRNKEDEELDEDEEEEGDEDEEEEGDEDAEESEEESEDSGDDDEGGEDDDEEAPKKKKKKVAKPKAPAKPKRTRTPKVVRMRVVWGVFNNSNQMVASYEYPKKAEAEAHVARLIADKRSTHFIQPVKEPIEEKKEK